MSRENSVKHELLVFFTLVLLVPAAWAQKYTITDLGPLSPTAINTWGQIVGDYNGNAFMWTVTSGMVDLGTIPGGSFSRAAAINDLGVVTGAAQGPGTVISQFSYYGNQECSDLVQPFVWTKNNGMKGLGTVGVFGFPDFYWCRVPFYASGINVYGKVVGYTSAYSSYQWGLAWTSAEGISFFGGSWPPTYVSAISNTGQIVGQNSIFETNGIGHATWWKDDVTTDLGSLGGGADVLSYSSSANGVNDLGQVVGWSSTDPVLRYAAWPPVHAVLWTPTGEIRDLGTLPGDTSSAAYKITFFGEVIGSSGSTDYYNQWWSRPFVAIGRPFIWSERDGVRDLNSLIHKNSGWVLNSATDINIWGQIVGSGTRNGGVHGFLLTPNKLLKR